MQQRRVSEEGLRIVKLCCEGIILIICNDNKLTVIYQKAPANYVPAAAVIRRGRALSGIIGRKEYVGGFVSVRLKPGAQLRSAFRTARLECGRGKWNL